MHILQIQAKEDILKVDWKWDHWIGSLPNICYEHNMTYIIRHDGRISWIIDVEREGDTPCL